MSVEFAAWSLGAFAIVSFVIAGFVIGYILKKNKKPE